MMFTRSIRLLNHSKVCCSYYRWTQVYKSSSASDKSSHESKHFRTEKRQNIIKVLATVGVGSGIALWLKGTFSAEAAKLLANIENGTDKFGAYIDGLPEYSMADIRKHDSMENGIWVSMQRGVYDITNFIKEHPGGDNILLGAGNSVEPFWNIYAIHKSPHVLKILEKYRIGNLNEKDANEAMKGMEDPFALEPKRDPILKPSSKRPFNAEPALSVLVDTLYTPNDVFYVRNHLPVPLVDPETYSLEIEGMGIADRTFSLDNIKQFNKHTVSVAVQCAGNRRSEMVEVKPVKGLSWGQAAISNAQWSGARLYDVLKASGLDEHTTKAQHVQFEGLDLDTTSSPYGASIPIEKALDPKGDVILAYEMNGQPLPRDHGFPIRVIVPGTVGARNVKWLGRIVISEEESKSHWQQNDYKGFAPNVDWDTVDFSKSPAIQEMPVTSAICIPSDGDTITLKDGKVFMKGYAYSGGGRKIVRVDVSVDGGKNWQAADTLETDSSKHPHSWGWTLWTAEVDVPRRSKELHLVAKSVDSSYNSQPESFSNIWNLRGVLSNAYHRVKVNVVG